MARRANREQDLLELTKVDRTIHEPARLIIMTFLFTLRSSDFLFLQRKTGLTGGNLSSHISKLEDAGYVQITKEFVERKPHTMIRLTKQGRQAYLAYRDTMRRVLGDG
jgi:DNA-binding transcriptional ArsR family regulator